MKKQKQSFVNVEADDMGNIIRVSQNNPEYGVIRITQNSVSFVNGWAKNQAKSALIPGKVNDLQLFVEDFVSDGKIEGKIVVKESLEPFNESNPERDYKYAFENGPLCVYEDQPIYRKSYFSMDLTEQDSFIRHTNSDEIREALAMRSDNSDIKPLVEKPVAKKAVAEKVEELVEESEDDNVTFDF